MSMSFDTHFTSFDDLILLTNVGRERQFGCSLRV